MPVNDFFRRRCCTLPDLFVNFEGKQERVQVDPLLLLIDIWNLTLTVEGLKLQLPLRGITTRTTCTAGRVAQRMADPMIISLVPPVYTLCLDLMEKVGFWR